jgi:ubiquinone/menaquinone biosynthesis C-methylase UbiE
MMHAMTSKDVYGVDITPEMIEEAKKGSSSEITFLLGDCTNF